MSTPSSLERPEHRFRLKIYFEDTDCIGVVYHANYLRYLERARTEFLASQGSTVAQWAEKGVVFMVYNVNITYRAPARLGDELEVVTSMRPASAYRATFEQRVESVKDQKVLAQATVELVCTDTQGSLRQFPDMGF
jgi:acyl-CoA thioester hydrolase